MGNGCVAFDNFDPIHKHVKFGRTVLIDLIIKVSAEANASTYHPTYDLSIWEDKQA